MIAKTVCGLADTSRPLTSRSKQGGLNLAKAALVGDALMVLQKFLRLDDHAEQHMHEYSYISRLSGLHIAMGTRRPSIRPKRENVDGESHRHRSGRQDHHWAYGGPKP